MLVVEEGATLVVVAAVELSSPPAEHAATRTTNTAVTANVEVARRPVTPARYVGHSVSAVTDDRGGDPACWSHLFDDSELAARGVVDLNALPALDGSGVIWSAPPGDLNVNLVSLEPGHVIEEHRNDALDVLVVVLSGDGEITVDDDAHHVTGQQLLLIPAGARRSFRAGQFRLAYLSIHRARGPAQIRRAGSSSSSE